MNRLDDNPWSNAALAFAQPLPIGLVAAGLSAAFWRRPSGNRGRT